MIQKNIQALSWREQRLLQELRSLEPSVRKHALLKLSSSRDEAVLEVVSDCLYDTDPEVRRMASQVLQGPRSAFVARLIVRAAECERWEVREAAINALKGAPLSRAHRALLNALDDDFPSVAVCAANALKGTKQPSVLDALLTKIQGFDDGPRVFAALALQETKDSRAISTLASLLLSPNIELVVREACATALSGTSEERGKQALIVALKDPHAAVRRRAARALEGQHDEATHQALVGLLDDPSAIVREQAARALGGTKLLPAIRALGESLLSDDDPMVKTACAEALAGSGEDQVLLRAFEREEHSAVRKAIIFAITPRLSERPTCNAMLATLQRDKSDEVRAAAALRLGLVCGDVYESALASILARDASPLVREAAARALRNSTSPWARELTRRVLVEEAWKEQALPVRLALIDALQYWGEEVDLQALVTLVETESSSLIREVALRIISEKPTKNSIAVLIKAAFSENEAMEILAIRGLYRLETSPKAQAIIYTKFLKSKSANVLLACLESLKGPINEELLSRALDIVRSQNPELREAAKKFLRLNKSALIEEQLLLWFKGSDPELRYLSACILQDSNVKTVLQELVELLADKSDEIRRASALALQGVKAELPRRALAKALRDPDPYVRDLARQGLSAS